MSSTIDEIYEQASHLSPTERAALAGLLLDTLEGKIEPEVESAWRHEITMRIKELDSGTAKTVPWPQVRDRLRSIVGLSS